MKISKKLFIVPAVVGLVLVPSVAMAQRGADDNKPNDIRREDRREDRRADRRQDRRNDTFVGSPANSNSSSSTTSTPRVDDNPSASDLAEGSATLGASTNPTSSSNSTNSSSSSPAPVSTTGEITVAQAKDIALSQYNKSTIRKTEVEIEHGQKMISVRFADGSRIDVSAADGTVTRVEIENSRSTTPRNDDDDNDDRSGRSGHGRDHSEDD